VTIKAKDGSGFTGEITKKCIAYEAIQVSGV